MKNKMYFRLVKVDEVKREVLGIATAEQVDKSGEICDYAATVPFYKAWSEQMHKASGGKSYGNIREMHDNKAVGKLSRPPVFNDEERQIEICAKIVEESTWQKILEGVLTGFSQGGSYAKSWKDPENPAITRYAADPAEISVVDSPCLGAATFELIRADGSSEMRKFDTRKIASNKVEQVWTATDGFTSVTKAEVIRHQAEIDAAALAAPAMAAADAIVKRLDDAEPMYWETELGKKEFSDDKRKALATEGKAMKDGSYPIESKGDLANAIQAFGRAKDPDEVKTHIIARAKALDATGMLPKDWESSTKKTTTAKLKKGLYQVSRVAELLQSLDNIQDCLEFEAVREGDDSPQPDHLKEIVKELCEFLVNLVTEETSELMDDDEDDMAPMLACAEKLPEGQANAMLKILALDPPKELDKDAIAPMRLAFALAKAGARHSKADTAALNQMDDAVDQMGDHVEKLGKMHKSMMEAHEEMGTSTHAEGMADMGKKLGKLGKHVEKMDKCHGGMQECMKALGMGSEGAGNQNGSPEDDAQKAEIADKLMKAEANTDALTGTVKTLSDTISALQKRLESVEQQPADKANRPALFVMEKGNETPKPVGESDDAPKENVFGSGVAPGDARRINMQRR